MKTEVKFMISVLHVEGQRLWLYIEGEGKLGLGWLHFTGFMYSPALADWGWYTRQVLIPDIRKLLGGVGILHC